MNRIQDTAEFKQGCDQLLVLINDLKANTELKVSESPRQVKKRKRVLGDGN